MSLLARPRVWLAGLGMASALWIAFRIITATPVSPLVAETASTSAATRSSP